MVLSTFKKKVLQWHSYSTLMSKVLNG